MLWPGSAPPADPDRVATDEGDCEDEERHDRNDRLQAVGPHGAAGRAGPERAQRPRSTGDEGKTQERARRQAADVSEIVDLRADSEAERQVDHEQHPDLPDKGATAPTQRRVMGP